MRHVMVGVLVLMPALASAQAEVRVFTGGAMSGPVMEAGNAFATSSGQRVVYVTDTTGALQQRGFRRTTAPVRFSAPIDT